MKFLTLKDGQASSRDVLSQADLTAAGEGGTQVFQKVGDRYFKMRLSKVAGNDPRAPAAWAIENWVPVVGVPQEVEDAAKQSNEEDAAVSGQKLETSDMPPTGQLLEPVQKDEDVRMDDPNWRNSVQAKEHAARIGAGNLALKDPKGMPHDGLPSDTSVPDSDQPLGRQELSTQNTGQTAKRDMAFGRTQSTAEATERSKPAAPSPTQSPPVVSPGTATPKLSEEGQKERERILQRNQQPQGEKK